MGRTVTVVKPRGLAGNDLLPPAAGGQNLSRSIAEAFGTSEILVRQATRGRAVVDALSVSDGQVRQANRGRVSVDAILAGDGISRMRQLARRLAENVGVSDLIAKSGSGAPAMPVNFQMTQQGMDSAALTWDAVSGATGYKVYRNGSLYASPSTNSYKDTSATNIVTPGYGPAPFQPATIYHYSVSATNGSGESTIQTLCMIWEYKGGTDFWTTSSNNFDQNVTVDRASTAGSPTDGATCIKVTTTASSGAFVQSVSGGPFLQNDNAQPDYADPPTWYLELGGMNFMTIDLKANTDGQFWKINLISRITTGDNFNSAQFVTSPQNVADGWVTHKIPFQNQDSTFDDGKSLSMGLGSFHGHISGTTLVVEDNVSGANVQGSAFLSGTGIHAGNTTSDSRAYVGQSSGNNGKAGSYAVVPSQTVSAGTLISFQRTNLYKWSIEDQTFVSGHIYYMQKIGYGYDSTLSG